MKLYSIVVRAYVCFGTSFTKDLASVEFQSKSLYFSYQQSVWIDMSLVSSLNHVFVIEAWQTHSRRLHFAIATMSMSSCCPIGDAGVAWSCDTHATSWLSREYNWDTSQLVSWIIHIFSISLFTRYQCHLISTLITTTNEWMSMVKSKPLHQSWQLHSVLLPEGNEPGVTLDNSLLFSAKYQSSDSLLQVHGLQHP